MTNPKAHRLKEKPSKAFPAPELAMGVTDEPSCISLHLLLAMRVSVLEQLSLPRSAGSLLLSQGGPQTPMSDALGVSPSCCSSPPAYSPCPSQALLLQSSPRRWGKKSFAERAQPHVQRSSQNHCCWDPQAQPLQLEGRAAPKRGLPLQRGLPGCRCLALPPQVPWPRDIWGHLSLCLAYVKISPRLTYMLCSKWQRAAG